MYLSRSRDTENEINFLSSEEVKQLIFDRPLQLRNTLTTSLYSALCKGHLISKGLFFKKGDTIQGGHYSGKCGSSVNILISSLSQAQIQTSTANFLQLLNFRITDTIQFKFKMCKTFQTNVLYAYAISAVRWRKSSCTLAQTLVLSLANRNDRKAQVCNLQTFLA